MKNLLILISCLVAVGIKAQSGPGRTQSPTNGISSMGSGGTMHALLQPQTTPITQTSSAIAEAITPDIQALAGNLGNDPTRIFNYVHDQIRYVLYYGSKKGAELTLLERSGNDFDQCALLSALLQAAGYSPTYQFGLMAMPYDTNTFEDLHHWLALNLNNTNWTTTLNFLGSLLAQRGFALKQQISGDTNHVVFQRIWVTLTIAGTTYYLDPAFKVSMPISGVNVTNAMGLNTNTLMTAAGGTDTGTSVTGLSESALRGALQNCNSNLLSYLSNNAPNATVSEVLGGQQIVSSSGLPLSTSLAFPLYTNSTYPLQNWTNQPTNFMGTFSITFAGTNQTWYTPQLEGQRVSLTFSNNGVAQLWLEDSQVLQISNTGTSNTANVVLSATHPYGSWNTTLNIPVDGGVSVGFDESFTNAYQRTNASYAILYAFEANPAWLQERQQQLDAYRQQGLADSSRQVVTETLNVMGLGWMVQTELAQELLCQEWGQLEENQHRLGRMAQESGKGYYVDVYLQLDGTFPSTGYNSIDITNENDVFDVGSYMWSAMEHGIIEQLQNSNLVAASTVKMLEIAATNSPQTIYLAYFGNWTTLQSSLSHYSSSVLATLSGLINNNGFIVLLPQNGSNHVAGASTWAGEAYVEFGAVNGQRVMGMQIGGGYNGGYVSLPSAIPSPPVLAAIDANQSAYFNPQSPTLQNSGQTGADPVNLVDGSFQITSTDLAVGQQEPRGLNLTRYYSSARRNSSLAGMAPGWLHSYYCNVLPTSDPEGGLGTTTVQQMAPMIVATYAALKLYNYVNPDAKNWTVTALIAKWGIDQLINNAVSVNLGDDTIQFLRQPNGSYSPPGNCTLSLLQTNGGYWLQERRGRTFKFGANNLLTNILDQYSQSMKLSYNSNNFVTNVTDWTNRSLTFTYSGGILTSVADNTGRSISYGYTGSDLTSYTDPEGKTSRYAYDGDHEALSTYDALSRLVVTNAYDGFGHVTTQLTQGNSAKTWQIFASGYYTVLVDPAGDQQEYTYDDKSRLIASEDGMGNVTQMFYDGQDHVTNTVSPLGEVNQFFYDHNNNLIETIDSLHFINTFVFDSKNNLITSTDSRGNSSHYGYNSQFSLTGSTNGNGDWTTSAYNSNGTLASRQDSGGTTTYAYDSYGQLNGITYPSSLGTESFVNSSRGDPTSHTDVRGFVTSFSYNNRRQLTNAVAPTNLTASATFDANANLSTLTDARGFVTSNNWSVTRHLLSTTYPQTSQGAAVVTSTYDSRDWLAEIQNPLGNPTYYTNDPAHRLIATTDSLLRSILFSYDNDSRQTAARDAASDQTTQTWNARGQVVKITDAATNIVGKAYDAAGNLIYLTNRDGNLWTFQYDGANRLTNAISPLGHSSSTAYNNRGLLQSTADPIGNTTTYGYDARGRMTIKTDIVGVNTYSYDGNNNLTFLAATGGPGLSWAYDAYNRVTSLTNAAGYVIQYRYDVNGNLTSLIYPGNLTVTYSYDSNSRLTNITDWSGRQTTVAYDLDGHLTSVIRPNNTIRALSYDSDGELTNIVENTTTKFPICFYTLNYNPAGRVQWEFKGPLPHSNSPPTGTMTYDADNRLSTFNGTSVTVDSDGRLTYGPGTNNTFGTYSYDARSQLTGGGGLTYGYDPAGNRTTLTNGSTVSTFVVSPRSSQLLMRINGATTNYYIYGPGLLYEIDVAGTTTTTAFYHYDSRGSTIALTDINGNPTDLIEYSPYGTRAYRYGTNATPFLYNGQFGVQTDPNGLLFMRARYYNPYISRFLNPDPSGFAGGLNFYIFGDGNPIIETDPFGLYGNPVSGPNGPIGPSSPFGPGGGYYIPAPIPPPSIGAYLGAGVVVGVTGAVLVTVGAPVTVSVLGAVGVPAATASAAVTTTIGVVGVVGGASTVYNAGQNVATGNWNNVAFDVGTLGGGALFGGLGGGRFIADNVSPSPSTVPPSWNPFTADYVSTPTAPNGYGFVRNPSLPLATDLYNLMGQGPTPSSGGGAATGISSGAGLFMQPSGSGTTSSPTGK